MASHSHKVPSAFGVHDGGYSVNQDRFLYAQLKGQVLAGVAEKSPELDALPAMEALTGWKYHSVHNLVLVENVVHLKYQ